MSNTVFSGAFNVARVVSSNLGARRACGLRGGGVWRLLALAWLALFLAATVQVAAAAAACSVSFSVVGTPVAGTPAETRYNFNTTSDYPNCDAGNFGIFATDLQNGTYEATSGGQLKIINNATDVGTYASVGYWNVFYYKPAAGFVGTDTISFLGSAPDGSSDIPGTLTITVTAPVSAPTVTGLSPSQGSTGGTTSVVITGTDFTGATGVTFGATAATGVVVNSATQITATAPAGTGTVNVRVTTSNGTSATGSANQYTYVAPPVASSFTASAVGYNSTGNSISVASNATNSPTSYAVGSATTANGGSVSINSSGVATYSAPTGFRGNDSFTFTATNAGGTSSSATVTTPVNNPTFSVTLPASTGTVGTVYNSGAAAVVVSGGKSPYSAFSATGLPAGLTMNSAGVISGTPTAATNATVVVTVTDSSTGTGPYTSTASASLNVSSPSPPVASSFTASAVAYNATGVSFSVSGHATNSPTNYAVGSATTANGGSVSVDSTGTVTYSAPTGFRGNDSFTFTATNPGGTSSPATVTTPVSNPTFSVTLPASTGTVGVAYNSGAAAVTMSGGKSPYGTFSATGLPAGLTMDNSGVISGTPTAVASATVVVTATDSSTGTGPYTSTASAGLTIAAPTISLPTTSLSAGTGGAAYSATLTAASGGTGPYTYGLTAGALPAGVTFNTGTRAVSGTPTATGTFNFSITATDSSTGTGAPFSATQTYSLTVNAPTITLATASLTNGAVATSYSASLPAASGGVSPYTYAVTGGALPAGVSLSSGGALSGAPTAGGTFNFTVTATDSSSGAGPYTGAQSYSLTVGGPTITVNPSSLTGATVATAYNQTLTATGGVSGYSFMVTSGALPAGVSLSSGGVLSGTPTAAGTFGFTVTATDSSGGSGPYTGQRPYSLVIAAPTLSLSPGSLPAPAVGTAYSQTVTASGGTAPYSYGLASGALPAGLSLNASTGAVSGTPTAGGVFSFSIQATDSTTGTGAPFQVSQTYGFTVAAPTVTLPATTLTDGAAGVAYSGALNAASGGTSPYSYIVTSGALPTGVSLSTGGALSGTPTAAGTFNFTVTATDSSTGSGPYTASRAYSLTINAPTVALPATTLSSATSGTAYSATLNGAGGGVSPYSYTLTAGALPAGISLSGLSLSGTPTAAGTFNFSVTATDSSTGTGAPFTATRGYSLVVNAPTLTLSPSSLTAGSEGVAYSQTFTASGGVAPYVFALTGALPTGVTFNTGTGVLSGTPSVDGSFPLTVSATDSSTGTGAPFTVSHTLTLSVTAAVAPTVDPAAVSAPAGSSTTIDVSTMIDGVYDTVVIVTPPTHGTAVVSSSSGTSGLSASGLHTAAVHTTIVYTPNAGYVGPDSFTYAASGPGGVSAPAAISVAVVTPAPVAVNDTASTVANQAVTIAVTTNDTGPLSTIAIAAVPTHGAAVVSGLSVIYTPTSGFFGTDTFTYTATGAGGTSAPATVTVTVASLSAPTAAAKVLNVLMGHNATLAATADATGGPFTAVAVAVAPSYGTATVAGETIVYAPGTGFSGTDHFSYTLANVYGASQPIAVTVTVYPTPLVAPPITLNILAGQTATTSLTTGATGGPFSGAAVVSVSPDKAGTTTITSPATGAYSLSFKPANDFAGTATISYTLSNAVATSAPGTVTVIVTARPDPTKDPEVQGLVAAQDAAARRFANAQINNFNRRLEQLHNGGGAGGAFGVSVQGGDPDRPDGVEAHERFRRYAQLGQNDGPIDRLSLLPAKDQDDRGGSDPSGPAGPDGKPSRWGVWMAGSADFGMRDAIGAQSGFRFTTDGLTAGADYRVNGQLAIGAGFGYGQDSSRIGHLGTKSQAQSYSGGVYASYQPAASLFIDSLAGYGTLDFSSRRYVTSTGELLYGDRGGDQVFVSVTAGLEHRDGGFLISPYGRLGATRSQLNAFTEVGGGPYGLTFQSQKVNTFTGTLGLRGGYAYKVSFGQVQPRFRLEYAHDFDGADNALINYADWVDGPTYQLAVDPTDRNQTRVELGLDILVQSGVKIGVDFNNTVSNNSDSQGLRISVGTPF